MADKLPKGPVNLHKSLRYGAGLKEATSKAISTKKCGKNVK
jgi:hypothetical protein